MTDEIQDEVIETPAEVETTDTEEERRIPRTRLNEVISERDTARDELKKMQKQLDKLTKAQEARERKEQQDAGEYQSVITDLEKRIEELEPVLERAENLESVLQEKLDAELENIPEEFRELIPEGSVESRLKWITKSQKAGIFDRKRKAPDQDIDTAGDKHPSRSVPIAEYEYLKQFMSDEEIKKYHKEQ